MKLRDRILLSSVLLVVGPLLLLALATRSEMDRRLGAQYRDRVGTLMALVEEDLASRSTHLAARLADLGGVLAEDNRFRLAVAGQEDQHPYLIDRAGAVMPLMGLDMLQIQDRFGVILSSGHYRHEYGRSDPAVPRILSGLRSGPALVRARLPRGEFLALARVDSLLLGDRFFYLVGGLRLDSAYLTRLARDRELAVSLVPAEGTALSSDTRLQGLFEDVGTTGVDEPEMALGRSGFLVRARDLPLVGETGESRARLIVSHPLGPLRAILRELDLWLALAVLAALAGSTLLAFWLAGRISRPLDQLARQTAVLDLDRLDAGFPTDRSDEVGTLSRFLAAMTERLRASAARLRDAERRATLGEIARQVNHDIRNGLTPLRNVIRHLGQVAAAQPDQLGEVFRQRRPTLESGLGYLDELASNYARLSGRREPRRCDLGEIAAAVLDSGSGREDVRLERALAPTPPVLADPVGLRRIVENLVRNAVESLPATGGAVRVATASEPDPESGEPVAVLRVADDGCGIPPEDLERVFEDFYSTKPHGSGLGLSNVRRLVADCEGTVRVSSEPGRGTTFTVTLPAAEGRPSPGEAGEENAS